VVVEELWCHDDEEPEAGEEDDGDDGDEDDGDEDDGDEDAEESRESNVSVTVLQRSALMIGGRRRTQTTRANET